MLSSGDMKGLLMVRTTPSQKAGEYLKDLAEELAGRGWTAVLKGRAERPVLWVRNPEAPDLNETILCKPQPDGGLAYCWSWSEPIALVAEVDAVADRIVHVLRCLAPKS